MESRFRGLFLSMVSGLLITMPVLAQDEQNEQGDTEQDRVEIQQPAPLIEPFILRADLTEADVNAQDIEFQAFWGSYSVEDFGVSSVFGATLGYHMSEDFFVEAIYAVSTVKSSSAEILGGFDLVDDDDLSYYNVSVAWNLMPGETFVWREAAFNSSLYVITGYGITEFVGEKKSTVNVGAGYRVVAWDWLALRVDVRNHMLRHELFVREKLVNNFEMRAGISVFF